MGPLRRVTWHVLILLAAISVCRSRRLDVTLLRLAALLLILVVVVKESLEVAHLDHLSLVVAVLYERINLNRLV